MADKNEPTHTDLVHEVLRSAAQPLTFQEIFDEVNRRRPVTTRDPKMTIRNALKEGKLVAKLGDGRYDYVFHILAGSVLRVPLAETVTNNYRLIYPIELFAVLRPLFHEIQKPRRPRPVYLQLPEGNAADLPPEFRRPSESSSPVPEELRRYLVAKQATAKDFLLIRIVDAEAGRCEGWLESHLSREEAAIAKRNQEVADAAYQFLRRFPSRDGWIADIVIFLIGQGVYRSPVVPDLLDPILRADSRFVYFGFHTWALAEAMNPERRAIIDRALATEASLLEFEEETLPSIDEAAPAEFPRGSMERTMSDIGTVLAEREFGSLEEVNTFLRESFAKGGMPHRIARTPVEQARDLIYDAWEMPSRSKRIQMAKKALEISPDCADAYVLLAEETADDPKEAADLYAKGVAAGERALGQQAFKDFVGEFWGFIETRPYMRARLGLAQALWALNRRKEALEHAWEMLSLNPGDNQGVRYQLLHWLLIAGDNAAAKKLLVSYPEDASAAWLYGGALIAFRTEGDTKLARKRRAEAKKWNPHVPPYLLNRKRLPRQLPETIGLGDESEAIYCASEQIGVWQGTPGALTWLAE